MVSAEPKQSRLHAWFDARSTWQRRGLAFGAGALATLGHAPFQLTLAFLAAVAVLVWLLDAAWRGERRFARAFGAGWWFGLGHFATGLYWISAAFQVDSDAWGPLWGVPATLGLAAGLALFWGFGAALAMAAWTRDWRRAAAFALAAFIAEWLRGHVFGGFPWLLPGYVWTPGEPVSQIASVIGVYGLSLVTLLAGAALAPIADGSAAGCGRFAPLVAMALSIGLVFGWGAQRLARAEIEPPGAQPIVRVADSGLSQAEKWRYRPDQEWRVLGRYLESTGTPEDSRASVVIWPEGAIPTINFFALDNQAFLDAIGRGLGDRVLITGLTRCEPRAECDAMMQGRGVGAVRLYNSATVIDGVSGVARLSQTYDKHRLVPFGEFIPMWDLVSQLNIAPLQRIGAGFTPGPRPSRLVIPGAEPALVLICYEAIFPGLIPRGEERPGWIISVTNDAWFGAGTGPYQHYAQARYRSIEEGLPMARAASGGISAVIDSYGREIRATHGRTLYAEAQIPPGLVEPPWSRWGNILLLALGAVIAALRFLPAIHEGVDG